MSTFHRFNFKPLLVSTIVSLLIAPLRGGYILNEGFKLSSIVGFIVYFILTVYFLKKKMMSEILIVISILVGSSILTLPIRIWDFQGTLISLLEQIIHISAIIMGLIYYKINVKLYKNIFLVVSLFICMSISTVGYDFWLHKLNYGTFTGNIEDKKLQLNFYMQDKTSNSVALSNFNADYVVIDCWYTRCKYCYDAMPQVQQLYDKYINNSKIKVFALHSRDESNDENFLTGTNILEKMGYTIPCLSIDIKDSALKDLGVNAYPVVLIFNREGKLVFKGNISSASQYLENLPNDKFKTRT